MLYPAQMGMGLGAEAAISAVAPPAIHQTLTHLVPSFYGCLSSQTFTYAKACGGMQEAAERRHEGH